METGCIGNSATQAELTWPGPIASSQMSAMRAHKHGGHLKCRPHSAKRKKEKQKNAIAFIAASNTVLDSFPLMFCLVNSHQSLPRNALLAISFMLYYYYFFYQRTFWNVCLKFACSPGRTPTDRQQLQQRQQGFKEGAEISNDYAEVLRAKTEQNRCEWWSNRSTRADFLTADDFLHFPGR